MRRGQGEGEGGTRRMQSKDSARGTKGGRAGEGQLVVAAALVAVMAAGILQAWRPLLINKVPEWVSRWWAACSTSP